MNVLLINGSPHKKGCTYTALSEVAGQLEKNRHRIEYRAHRLEAHSGLYRVRRLPGNRAVRV